jgi:uncharacterized membrane protein
MVKNEKIIVIDRPIEEVFAFVGDLQNAPRWQPGLLEARRITDCPLAIGTKFTSVRKFLGRKMESSVEFVTYEPNKKIVFRSAPGSMPMEVSYLFKSMTDGTQLSATVELQPGGLLNLAAPMMAAGLRRDMETDFDGLKILLESPVTITS